jgi:divalent metal cation (Fe/Co/Zn/Cd) transporter
VTRVPIPLVDKSPEDIAQEIKRKVQSIKQVKDCQQVDVQASGKWLDVEMVVKLDSSVTLDNVHAITMRIEKEVKKAVPNARLQIHTESADEPQGLWKFVKDVADGVPGSRGAHSIHIQTVAKKTVVDLHLEVDASMTVEQAHDTATVIEHQLKGSNRGIADVNVHIETTSDRVTRETRESDANIEEYIHSAAGQFPEITRVGKINIRKVGEGLHVTLHAHFDPDLNIEKAHQISTKLERMVRNAYVNVTRLDVHEEPG